MKTVTKYVAHDGAEFDTEAACRAHEREHAAGRLIGLTADDLEKAVTGEDVELGDAIEAYARKISIARRDRGDIRRRPASTTTPAEAVPAEGPPAPEAAITLV